MKFEITGKNIKIDDQVSSAIQKATNRIGKVIKSMKADGETGFITIRRYPKPEKYSVHINFQIPGKLLSAKDFGFTIEEALHKASLDAREQVLKLKDRLKDVHEKKRRSRSPFNSTPETETPD